MPDLAEFPTSGPLTRLQSQRWREGVPTEGWVRGGSQARLPSSVERLLPGFSFPRAVARVASFLATVGQVLMPSVFSCGSFSQEAHNKASSFTREKVSKCPRDSNCKQDGSCIVSDIISEVAFFDCYFTNKSLGSVNTETRSITNGHKYQYQQMGMINCHFISFPSH